MHTSIRIETSWLRLLAVGLLGLLVTFWSPVGVLATDPGDMVCELKVGEDDDTSTRIAESLHLKTFSDDPDLLPKWNALFGVDPESSMDDIVTLQSDSTLTWEAGVLEMGIKIFGGYPSFPQRVVSREI